MLAPSVVAKWGWPVLPTAAAAILAVDSTLVTQYVIGAVQALLVALLVYRQARDRHRTDVKTAELDTTTATTAARIDGTDRLIDQLQQELDRAERRTQATELARVEDRSLIDELQTELRGLNRRVLRLNRRHTSAMIGIDILTQQLQELEAEPRWKMATVSGDHDLPP